MRSESSGHLVVLCGVSFAGKSTAAGVVARLAGARVVSLDEVNAERGLRSGDGVPAQEWQRTHEIAAERVRAALADGRTTVVDDTSSLRFLRENWRRLAEGAGARFTLVWVRVDDDAMVARLAANRVAPTRDDVTDEVLAGLLAAFEPPAAEEDAVQLWSGPALEAAVAGLVTTRLAGPSAASPDQTGPGPSRHLGVRIAAPAWQVYAFAADPASLPRWAAGLAGTGVVRDGATGGGDGWVADSPMGRVRIEFTAANDLGVLDHTVTLPSGDRVLNPVRVIPDGTGCEVVFTVRWRAGVRAGDFEADCRAVAADLETLRELLEAVPAGGVR